MLLCIGFPIYLILLLTSLVAVIFVADVPLTTLQTNMFGSLDNFPLLAIPFFILAGEIMGQGGIAQARHRVGHRAHRQRRAARCR